MADGIDVVKKLVMQSYRAQTTISIVDYDGYAYKGIVSGIDRLFRAFEMNDEWYDPIQVEYIEQEDE